MNHKRRSNAYENGGREGPLPRRGLEGRIRELERQLGRKTLEAELLKEALDRSRSKKPILLTASPLKDGSR